MSNINFNNKSNKWLINLTTINIPEETKQILSLGPKFNFPNFNKQIDIPNLITDIEYCIQDINLPIKNKIRLEICNSITYFSKSIKLNITKQHLKEELQQKIKTTKLFLKNNNNLLILQSDKTNNTVIMDKQQYNNKMLELLSNTDNYQQIKNNPILKLQNTTNSFAKNLLNNNYIDDSTYKKLICHNGTLARIYGLPKLHKINHPLRPIVAAYTEPQNNLSKYFSKILKNTLLKSKYISKDSWHLKHKIDTTISYHHNINYTL